MANTKKKSARAPRKLTKTNFTHAELLVIGFTGSLGSGCTYLVENLSKELHDGRPFALSDIITDELIKEGITKPTIQQKQDKGNDLRNKHGVSVLAEKCLDKINKNINEKTHSDETVILVDGIRNDGEIRFFRALPNFFLFSVHANESTRKKRSVGRAHKYKFKSNKEFETADKRDKEEEIIYGQQVNKCNYLADIIIDNEVDYIKETEGKRSYFQMIEREYIDRIQQIQKGTVILDHPPKIMETLMTMAYCVSKRSSCDKRKVGAIVAYLNEYNDIKTKRPEDNITFQVISSGYNEVPLGTDPCRLGEEQKCQRDFLKEEFAKQLDHCPKCGTKIPRRVKADFKKFSAYKCENENCEINILNEYLPGTTNKTGKLLDMCRALHGEEISLLGLEGISKQRKSNGKKGKFVLYTTTYPCNLCANKIVAAGIDEVVYAEPYTMEEAEKILNAGRVQITKFQGVKSTAYFKLYSY
jgi:cytidine deaminase